MITVFDFDKTLTYKDTLFGFLLECLKNDLFLSIKIMILLTLMVAHKAKLITNDTYKRICVLLFLRGKTKTYFRNCAKSYSKKIKLNKIYYEKFVNYDNPLIVSASFTEYMKFLFPSANIYGAELKFEDDRIKKLKNNCYGKQKCEVLNRIGIRKIDELFTDSLSDLPLAKMAEKINFVRGDTITLCNEISQFIKLTAKF